VRRFQPLSVDEVSQLFSVSDRGMTLSNGNGPLYDHIPSCRETRFKEQVIEIAVDPETPDAALKSTPPAGCLQWIFDAQRCMVFPESKQMAIQFLLSPSWVRGGLSIDFGSNNCVIRLALSSGRDNILDRKSTGSG
jgi:hypothetical protein